MSSVIRLDNVKKRYGDREILKGIGFAVEQGDIFGYLGANGAGKTTTIRILLDLVRPAEGGVFILGQPATGTETRKRVGFVLDADGLYNELTAMENLEFYSRLYGKKNNGNRMKELLGAVGLADRAGDRAGTFSKGMRQRLAIARALVHDPDLLILDEPLSGIDPPGQMELRQIILEVVRKEGKTVFFSSHNLDEVQRICNRIALIDKGEIRLCGELAALMGGMADGLVLIQTEKAVDGRIIDELAAIPAIGFREQSGGTLSFAPANESEVPAIVSLLVSRGVGISGVRKKEHSLEELYASILDKEKEGTE
jgi:ABC-2 type transport system ATP-binding protein